MKRGCCSGSSTQKGNNCRVLLAMNLFIFDFWKICSVTRILQLPPKSCFLSLCLPCFLVKVAIIKYATKRFSVTLPRHSHISLNIVPILLNPGMSPCLVIIVLILEIFWTISIINLVGFFFFVCSLSFFFSFLFFFT